MKRMLFFIGSFLPFIAFASDWHFVGCDDWMHAVFYDITSVSRTNENTVKAKVSLIEHENSKDDVLVSLWEIDKTKKRMRIIKASGYKNKKVLGTEMGTSDWKDVVPNTFGAAIFDCVVNLKKSENHYSGSDDGLIRLGRKLSKEIILEELLIYSGHSTQ